MKCRTIGLHLYLLTYPQQSLFEVKAKAPNNVKITSGYPNNTCQSAIDNSEQFKSSGGGGHPYKALLLMINFGQKPQP